MKKTLRKKFIIFTMTTVTLLLVLLIGAINLSSWHMLDSQSDAVLDMLVSSNGMPKQMHFKAPPPFSPRLNMDMMQATRFFTVRISEDGKILKADINRISSIDESKAISFAKTVIESEKEEGSLSGYKFKRAATKGGSIIFFMDTSAQSNTILTVLLASCTIALLSWLVIFIFVILLSGKVVRPILANIEKQKQFITNAGHELKTPLAIIQTNNDAMSLVCGENKYTSNIRAQTHRLDSLMHNLLTLARLDEEAKFPTQAVDISSLTESAVAPYALLAAKKDITFTSDVASAVTLVTNRDMFSQLVSSLLDNAVKYTNEGGVITLSLTREGKNILLVEENSCAKKIDVPPERLFERFYRGDSARTQEETSKGYGIGLSAARAICEALGGKLTASYPQDDTIRFTAKF